MTASRVVVADNDRLARDVLRLACTRRGVDVVGEAEDVATLRRLVAANAGEIVVLADTLDGAPVEPLVPELVEAGVKVIVLSGDPSPSRVTTLLSAGASGYLLHDADPDEVATAVLAVGRGAAALHPTAAATILAQWRRLREAPPDRLHSGIHALTPRESEVLVAMVAGLATKAIAQRLSLAHKTVENHKVRIFDKLGVRTQAQAVTVALAHGVVAPAVDDQPSGTDDGR